MHLPPARFRPVAAGDVAALVAQVAVGEPLEGIVEVAGPEEYRFDEFIALALLARQDPRTVVVDPHARYFGTEVADRELVPSGSDPVVGETTREQWSTRRTAGSDRGPAGNLVVSPDL